MEEGNKRNLTQRSQFFYDKMHKDYHGDTDSILYRIQAARYRDEVNGMLDFVSGRSSHYYRPSIETRNVIRMDERVRVESEINEEERLIVRTAV